MAKKLIQSYYTFDSVANTLTINGYVKLEELLIITNVTLNDIVYNFADSAKGGTVSYSEASEQTTITFVYAAIGASNTDKFQIFIDVPEQKMDVSDALLDPVHKIRVSTPENLIDTDFEYGLQPTKWETLELSNNVASYYVDDADGVLGNIVSVNSTAGSNQITIVTNGAHGLPIGIPIQVLGVNSRSAEGKFLIKFVTENTIVYTASATQSTTGNIAGAYTTISPGRFYNGADISYDEVAGITSDEELSSRITVNRATPHGFVEGSNFYLTNTIANKRLAYDANTDTSNTAADSDRIVEFDNTVIKSVTPDLTLTETKQYIPLYHRKFNASAVNTTTNRISWPNHGLRNNDTVLYVKPSNDTAIGGLNSTEVYYVIVQNADEISLTTTFSGTAIDFTSAGTYNYGRAVIGIVYELIRGYMGLRINRYAQLYTSQNYYGIGSGWDMQQFFPEYNGYGLGGVSNFSNYNAKLFLARGGRNLASSTYAYINRYSPFYSTGYNSLTQFPDNNLSPSVYNFVEDFTYWAGSYNASAATTFGGTFYSSSSTLESFYSYTGISGTSSVVWGRNVIFWVPLVLDPEADTLYATNHGLQEAESATITTNSGNNIVRQFSTVSTATITSGSTVGIESKGANRFGLTVSNESVRLKDVTGSYTIDAELGKATKNTFYFNDHGLSSGQRVKFQLDGAGAVLPTTQVGDVQVDTLNTLPTQYNIVAEGFLNAWGSNNLQSIPTPTSQELSQGYIIGPSDIGNLQLGWRQAITGTFRYYDSFGNNLYTRSALSASDIPDIYSETIFQPLANDVNFSDFNISVYGTDLVNRSSNQFILQLLSQDSPYKNNINEGVRTTQYYPGVDRIYLSSYYTNYSYTYSFTGPNQLWYYGWAYTAFVSGGLYYIGLKVKARPRNRINTTAGVRAFYTFSGSYAPIYASNDQTYQGDLIFHIAWISSSVPPSNTTTINNLINSIITYYDQNFRYPALDTSSYFTVNTITPSRFRVTTDGGIEADLTSSGVSPFSIITEPSGGIADGGYVASDVTSSTISFDTSNQILPVSYEFDATSVSNNTIITSEPNHFVRGAEVIYSAEGNTPIAGLTDGVTYYVISYDDEYLSLALSVNDAVSGTPITITSSTGTHKLISRSISGYAKTPGTVQINQDSNQVVGTNTLFKRYFKIKDDVTFLLPGTPGSYYKATVLSIADDTHMQLSESIPFSEASAVALTTTKLYTRPDGYAVHRPFDGGVEIAAGTAPYSQITRQTRKYFRYQSGKGIQTSLAINFNPPVLFESISATGTIVTGTTKYPHRLSNGQLIVIKNASDPVYNDEFAITKVDEFTFTFDLGVTPTTSLPSGIIKYNLVGYSGAATRAGMFDFQNGFFYEFDGQTINCVRRSSTTQLSGTVTASPKSNRIIGTGTNFVGQIQEGSYIVIRGMTHKVIQIVNQTEMYVQPEFRGASTTGAILTLVEDVRIPQNQWNIDRCDGQGPEGYHLDINQIQMAYMDYSWYGAGKIRFGFKDRSGHVRYVHEFIHNNRLDEAYMRSGNLPAKYEVINNQLPTYAPTLFHWGTSVIMDGRFDEDEAYLFTAPSQTLTFYGGDTLTVNTIAQSAILEFRVSGSFNQRDYFLRLPFATSAASSIATGVQVSTSSGVLGSVEGSSISYTDYSPGQYNAYVYLGRRNQNNPITSPVVASGTAIIIGGANIEVNLGTDVIPLVSLRLAPSVDSNLPGGLGERDIINRMQLKLKEVGLILTHDCEVKLILNGSLSNVNWEAVKSPSLSQLLKHDFGETLNSGIEVFSFRATGGTVDSNGRRGTSSSEFPLDAVIDMGNSILGGDGAYPNGPDVLTVAVQLIDTSQVNSASPFQASGRITWSESQA